MKRYLLLTAAALLVGAPLAHAQSTHFITLDRQDEVSRAGVDLGFATLDAGDTGNVFLQLQLYGQYAAPNQAWGLYGLLPLSMAFIEGEDDQSAAGNLEVGAFVHGGSELEVIGRFGLCLPTADDSSIGFATNIVAGYWRLADMFTSAAPNTTWLRASGSLRSMSGQIFTRADLGFDIPISSDNGAEDTLIHLSGGVGWQGSSVAITAELVNVGNLSSDGDLSERFVHNLAFSIASTGRDQLSAALILPLDDEFRGDLWMFSAGYQRAF